MSFATTAAVGLCIRCNTARPPCVTIEGDNHTSTSLLLHSEGRRGTETIHSDVVVDASACGIEDTSRVCYHSLCDRFGAALAEGLNACLITYGQSGTGKTSIMFGGPEGAGGVGGRVLQDIVDLFAAPTPLLETSITTTAVEMANDRVRDLLDGHGTFQDRKVRSHPELGTCFEGLTRSVVSSTDDVQQLLRMIRGNQRQRNRDGGSDSHIVVQLQARRRDLQRGLQQMATLYLADLAGCKGGKATTQGGKSIQMSLHVLRRVVELAAFASTKKDSSKSSYRLPVKDTPLTWIMGDIMYGNGLLSCVCCISASASDLDETTKTLRFATQLRKIRCSPVRVEEKCDVVVHAIQQEMAAIQNRLQATPRDRQDDLNRLQKELSFRAQQLQEEENRKVQTRDALHVQVQRTELELEKIRLQLTSRREAAATAGALQAEVARLGLARDIAVKRMAEEEAQRKKTEMRIAEARAIEADIQRLRADKERMEKTAQSEQRDQSRKMLRTVFKVATTMEKDRHMRCGIERINRRLQQRIDDCVQGIASSKLKMDTIAQSMDSLTEVQVALQGILENLEGAKDHHLHSMQVLQHSAQLVQGAEPEQAMLPLERMIGPPPELSSVKPLEYDVGVALLSDIEDTLMRTSSTLRHRSGENFALESRCFEQERRIVLHEGSLEHLQRSHTFLQESAVECAADVERMEREVAFLEKLLCRCDASRDSHENCVHETKASIRSLDHAQESPRCRSPQHSRSFSQQRNAMLHSPYFRRFT